MLHYNISGAILLSYRLLCSNLAFVFSWIYRDDYAIFAYESNCSLAYISRDIMLGKMIA